MYIYNIALDYWMQIVLYPYVEVNHTVANHLLYDYYNRDSLALKVLLPLDFPTFVKWFMKVMDLLRK